MSLLLRDSSTQRYCLSAFLLCLLVFIIYSNSLNSPWLFDDYGNIKGNPGIQINNLAPSSIFQSFYASPKSENLNRPFSYFTFALNWYLGKDHVTGYHLVNIGIHILTALLLFSVVLLIYRSNRLKETDSRDAHFIALLSACLWVISPIQVQAVTYIVQRMASLAALFFILGIYCYIKGRLSAKNQKRAFLWATCGLCYLLAVLSKQNAITLPIIILLIEFIFFQDLSVPGIRKKFIGALAGIISAIVLIGLYFILQNGFNQIIEGYQNRPFTISERFLTQPRVLIYYLSQIFYPLPSRLSIVHDFPLSTSIIAPWTTLPCFLLIIAALGMSLVYARKYPLVSFALLFFFVTHGIESTIMPLEIFFEHRNYLPSLFLFVPLAALVKKGVNYYQSISPVMHKFLIVSVSLLIFLLGTGTYIRNMDWATAKTFWEDAIKKAPTLTRPYHNLAWGYYQKTGQYDKAVALYEKGLTKKGMTVYYKAPTFYNLAGIYYSHYKNYPKAIEYAQKAIKAYPEYMKPYDVLCLSLIKLGRFDEAKGNIHRYLKKSPNALKYISMKGMIHLQKKSPEKALQYFRRCLRKKPDTAKYYTYTGLALKMLGHLERSAWFYHKAMHKDADNPLTILCLADLYLEKGKDKEVARYAQLFLYAIGIDGIEGAVKKINNNSIYTLLSWDRLEPFISAQAQNQCHNITDQLLRIHSN